MRGGLKFDPGSPETLGAVPSGTGVNFALFSANAEKVELCLFDKAGKREIARLALPERTGDVWHGFLRDSAPGLLYGYRVYGPYEPFNGHRFNPNKLLIDPYARALDRPLEWSELQCGYIMGDREGDLSFDTRDDAAVVPKCRVVGIDGGEPGGRRRATPLAQSVIYELHVRGYTMRHQSVPERVRGTFAGLGQPEIVRYLRSLGVTAVELLPIHPVVIPQRLAQHGLRDYWGYNSINFFAPEPRYLSGGDVYEFREMVHRFHDAGIEVILDVVFNHSGEGGVLGPTLSFRGIDNASYYGLTDGGRNYLDVTGCDNALNFDHPRVLQMVMDSLRYWVREMHVDGFRVDLAVTLARNGRQFSANAPFFTLVMQDPVLAGTKLIAEPWDLGAGGYQLGAFPQPWSEWNDKSRDAIRRFWRGDAGMLGPLAYRLTGSSDVFGHARRRPQASVNFVTAHDGFTLEDLVSYATKHNDANREDNLDGANENWSANYGVEGPAENPEIVCVRQRQKRNMLATLLLSQGVPMLLGGDEFSRTQKGNNNAYCQDNDVSWIDWELAEENADLVAFVRRLIAFRTEHGVFRRPRFFHGDHVDTSGTKDIVWLRPDGKEMTEADWNATDGHCLGVRYAAIHEGENGSPAFLLLMNAAPEGLEFVLPDARPGAAWTRLIDTTRENSRGGGLYPPKTRIPLEGRSLALFSSTAG